MKRTEYPNHPTFLRAKAYASGAGSAATTYHGIIKFASAHGRTKETSLYHHVTVIAGLQRLTDNRESHNFGGRHIIRGAGGPKIADAMKARKADPEAKRARDDAHFRRNYLARLRRQEKEILRVDTIDAVTAHAETGLARMNEVARLRSLATRKPQLALAELPPSGAPTIRFNERDARKVNAPIIMRGKDAVCLATRRHSYGHHEAASTDWSKGRNKPRHIRARHDNYVRAFAVISQDLRTIDFVLHNTFSRLTLPQGYVWNADQHGLRACVQGRPHIDFHPDYRELTLPGAAEHIVQQIEANRQKREEMKAQETAEKAAIQGVYVCLADSTRAGNCVSGSIAFAERHHIDPQRHYPALELLAMANGDASRVRLAITAARLRHEREMAQGFAVLAEHQVS